MTVAWRSKGGVSLCDEMQDLALAVGERGEDLGQGVPPGGEAAKKASTRVAIAGLKMASPLPTARIESTISSSSASLRTYPRAPALKAMNTESSSSKSVTIRMRTIGFS